MESKLSKRLRKATTPLVLDVIITDINMPKINGLEAIQFFQQEWPRVPLMVMTGYPNLETGKRIDETRVSRLSGETGR